MWYLLHNVHGVRFILNKRPLWLSMVDKLFTSTSVQVRVGARKSTSMPRRTRGLLMNKDRGNSVATSLENRKFKSKSKK